MASQKERSPAVPPANVGSSGGGAAAPVDATSELERGTAAQAGVPSAPLQMLPEGDLSSSDEDDETGTGGVNLKFLI